MKIAEAGLVDEISGRLVPRLEGTLERQRSSLTRYGHLRGAAMALKLKYGDTTREWLASAAVSRAAVCVGAAKTDAAIVEREEDPGSPGSSRVL